MEKIKRHKIFAFILIIGAILRFTKLDFQSFWYEELVSVYYTNVEGFREFFSRYLEKPDFSPPLYHFFIYCVRSLFGASDWILRAPSAFFGIATIVITYIFGRRIIGQQGALIATAMTAVSGPLIYYSQEMRYNSALVFFTLLFAFLFLDYHREIATVKTKLGLAISALVLIYTHYLGLFFVLQILIVSTLLKRSLFKHNLLFTLGILMAFVPWMMVLIQQTSVWSIPKPINASPNLFSYIKSMLEFAFFYRPYWFSDNSESGYVNILMISAASFLAISALLCLKKHFNKFRLNLEHYYLWGIFLLNIVFIFIADSNGAKKYFYEKNLLFTLPFLYLSIGTIIDRAYSKKTEKLAFMLGCTLLMLYRPMYVLNYYGRVFKTEFRTSAEIIARDYSSLPVLVMCGDPEWYDHYFSKFKINNITFVKNAVELNDFQKAHNKMIVTYAHCFPDPILELEMEKSQKKILFESKSLSCAALHEL